MPIPNRADQTLDFVGRWSNERNPQRRDIGIGRWVRESLEGRSGHNFTIGEIALTRETNFANGEAWSIALSWSGNSQYSVEKTYEGMQSLGAREYFMPGEMVLKKNDLYEAPRLIAAYSSEGLDGLAQAHHAYLRSRKSHPTTPRPLTLNLWEAIDFDHAFSMAGDCGMTEPAARVFTEETRILNLVVIAMCDGALKLNLLNIAMNACTPVTNDECTIDYLCDEINAAVR
ncbi:MAG: hypothetical protein EBX85_04590 [Actinobacteria bacterium]|nr:hypothetical protein [Actinomycetota bacterium]